MVTSESGHPSAEKLNAFALGRLNDAESAEIEVHLATCTVCQEVFRFSDESGKPLPISWSLPRRGC